MMTYTIKVIDTDKAISRPSGYIDEYTVRAKNIDDLRRKLARKYISTGSSTLFLRYTLAVYRGTEADDFKVPDVGFMEFQQSLNTGKARILWKPTQGASRGKVYRISPDTGRIMRGS